MSCNASTHIVLVIIGVCGSGKTTVAELLAQKLGATFLEGDDFHTNANLAKLSQGIALDDNDRAPWLEAITQAMENVAAQGQSVVVSCSALKESYRSQLSSAADNVRFVWLDVAKEVLEARLKSRTHFIDPILLDSQLATLEPPQHALRVDGQLSPENIVAEIMSQLL